MSQRLADLEAKNRFLFDLLFRHQVYVEGVKAGFALQYRAMLHNLYDAFAKYVGQTRWDTLDNYSRAEIERFIYKFKLAQTQYYNQYTQKLIELLKQFVAVDKDVLTNVYETATGQTTTERHNAPQPGDLPSVHGLRATHNTEAGNERVWNVIENGIVPASGLTIPQMLKEFEDSTTAAIAKRIRIAWANAESPKEMLDSIVGNADANYRDGMFATFDNRNRAILATSLQYATTVTNSAIASVHFNLYQWVSVLDSRTTEICRSRNGNIYVYGEGPLPPAHWNCRSKDVPLFGDGEPLHDIPGSFFDWLATQPKKLLNDMIGTALAAKVVAGDNSVKGISVNELVIPLTLSHFRSKINLIAMSAKADRG